MKGTLVEQGESLRKKIEQQIEDDTIRVEFLGKLPGGLSDALAVSLRKDQKIEFVTHPVAFEKALRGRHLSDLETKVLSSRMGTEGGYLIPELSYQEYLRATQPISPILDKITERNLTAGDSYPLAKNTTAFQAVRRTETESHAVTADLGLGLDRVPVFPIVITPQVSTALLEALNVPLTTWPLPDVLDGMRKQEAYEILNGTGVGEIEGILTCPTIATVNSGNASALTADGLLDLFYAVPEPYRSNGSWVMNRATAKAAKKLKDSSNQPIYQSGLFGVSPDVIHGRPLLLDDTMPDIGANAFPVIFGDLAWFYLIIREALAVLPDPYSQKGFVVLDCTRRSGGQAVRPEAFARQKVSA